MKIPSSTYRIQFNKEFTFNDLNNIIEYLDKLGVATIYASPIFKATSGSMHGYDVTDPWSINPEIGSLDELKKISKTLSARKIQWLQDIVPNHMAYDLSNDRLKDVLERGKYSEYYHYFDVEWNHPDPELKEKIMVPLLGKELNECLRDHEIQIGISEEGFTINYFDYKFPISVTSWHLLFSSDQKSMTHISKLIKDAKSHASSGVNLSEWKQYKSKCIGRILGTENEIEILRSTVSSINKEPGKIKHLLQEQFYTLTFWKHTEKKINYRRFFTVNTLICLRMEDKLVFDEYHRFIRSLYDSKIIHGLRIDHIDGLNDPSDYIRNLRELFGNSCYIIAEKILEAMEDVPESWPLEGTSGYEFLYYVNQLFTNKGGARKLEKFYRSLIPEMPPYNELVFENKKLILENYMAGEWDNLVRLFYESDLSNGFEQDRIRQAIALVMLSMPVYRIYPDKLPLKGNNLSVMNEAFSSAAKRGEAYISELTYLKDLFTGTPADDDQHRKILKFMKRLMQFTGPLTAKGVEDTTFYVYNPLISHDEVGDTPSTLGITIQDFHNKMLQRQKRNPLSLNTTATHDTKRGEDARLRLNVLSELPGHWQERVTEWMKVNKDYHTTVNGKPAPDLNDEYFIYQTITGGFPEDGIVTEEFIQRLSDYLTKATREAKVNSSWETPNEPYESACANFIRNILSPGSQFLQSFAPFFQKVSNVASIYALSQVLIKITTPGIPDIYRGCELWDLSFVDPDNRRILDYDTRMNYLDKIILKEKEGPEIFFTWLKANRDKGIEKLFVTWKALNFRRNKSELFVQGDYIPLTIATEGINSMAYARRHKNQWAIIVVPLDVAGNQHDAILVLPKSSPVRWINVLTNEPVTTTNGTLELKNLFSLFPVALCTAEDAMFHQDKK